MFINFSMSFLETCRIFFQIPTDNPKIFAETGNYNYPWGGIGGGLPKLSKGVFCGDTFCSLVGYQNDGGEPVGSPRWLKMILGKGMISDHFSI